MEQEAPKNVKALRAMFQEEARVLALVKARERPAVAEKPRRLPPTVPGGQSSSLISPVHEAVENRTMPVVPRVIFRDGTRSSGGKRPIPFSALVLQATPPKPPTPHQEVHQNGHHIGGEYYTATAMEPFKGCYIPLRLTCPPMKEQKKELSIPKEVPPQTKCKKKSLLLHHPFKSTKVPKVGGESVEESTNADKDLGGPVKGFLINRHKAEDGLSLQAEHSSTEGPSSSPEILITPPLDVHSEELSSMTSTTQFFSTLEKAKKRFSPRNLLVYARPKSLCSNGVHHLPDHNSSTDKGVFRSTGQEDHAPDRNVHAGLPAYVPCLASVSARPFVKMNGSPGQSASKRHFEREKAGLPVRLDEFPPPPPRKPLPDRGCIGLSPVKPPRPPWVYLSCYQPTTEHHGEFAPEIEPDSCVDPDSEPPFDYNPKLVVPEFPDFELNLKPETTEGNALNLAVLELEATEYRSLDPPVDFRLPEFQTPRLDLPSCEPSEISSFDCESLTPSSHHDLVFPDPVDIPDPSILDFWEQKRVLDPQAVAEMSADLMSGEPLNTERFGHDPASVPNENLQPLSRVCYQENYYETCDNVYEAVENINKFPLSQNSRKQKGPPKNPYGTPQPTKEEPRVHIWPRNSCKERTSPENPESREQMKREKHRLEKEKKEQKEKEKKDGEMKKKFKVTGHEEAMYHARVTVASKLRKNDLPVRSGDTVGIIRTTSCPKGKWLARDASHKYGYISVMNVELNIKEMLELGKKAQAAGRGGTTEADAISIGSRSSNRNPMPNNSFTDDDEEWTLDEENPSPLPENRIHNRTVSMPDMLCIQANVQPTVSDVHTEDLNTQARHMALQKLAVFFQYKEDMTENGVPFDSITEAHRILSAVEPQYSDQEVDFSDVELLPPPVLYADGL